MNKKERSQLFAKKVLATKKYHVIVKRVSKDEDIVEDNAYTDEVFDILFLINENLDGLLYEEKVLYINDRLITPVELRTMKFDEANNTIEGIQVYDYIH